jgi:hypothetical protein
MPRLPIRDHAFFEQTVFEGQFGHDLLQGVGLAAKVLDLVRVAASVMSPASCFFLQGTPSTVLDDPLPAEQLRDPVPAALYRTAPSARSGPAVLFAPSASHPFICL